MEPLLRTRAFAGAATPPLLVVVVLVLTAGERTFLREAGWSAIHRTNVEWPSLLALGAYGWLMVTAFVVSGVLGLAFASAVWEVSALTSERAVAALVAVMSIAIALEAFRPDPPYATGRATWHDLVHNAAFPAIPLASIAATAVSAYSGRLVVRPLIAPKHALILLAVMAAALGLVNLDHIAQLARYFYFGALLIWIELLALGALDRSRTASPNGACAFRTAV